MFMEASTWRFSTERLVAQNCRMHASMTRLLDFARKATVDSDRPVHDFPDLVVRLRISAAVMTNWKSRGISKAGAIQAEKEFGCSASWLLTGGGSEIAAPSEVEEKPPRRYRSRDLAPGPESRGKVPLISWVQAGAWAESCDVLEMHEVERWLDCFVPHSECTAALRVRGDSMTALTGASKSYPEGSIIFVDFEKKCPINGQRIVAKIDGGNEVTFKVFKDEDGRKWLQPLNPSHEPIRDPFKVLGTVIGKWEDE
jgi:SOS-response transcriptional repressor LexA